MKCNQCELFMYELHEHKTPEQYSCTECSFILPTKIALRDHLEKHGKSVLLRKPTRPYYCPYCPYTYDRSKGMVNHIQRVHGYKKEIWEKKWDLYKQGKAKCPFNRDEGFEEK